MADTFGDLAPERYGFELLIDARWLHRGPAGETVGRLPEGWSVVDTVGELTEWATAHDYADVLPAAVLDHPRFRILARRRAGALVGGAVTHDGGGAVGLSNTWGEGTLATSDEVLAAVATLYPGRPVTDFAHGIELDAMVTAGFTALGPQRVWVR